jgi:hypothetical protein
MKIAARRIDAERPSGAAKLLPRGQAEGVSKQMTKAPRCGRRIGARCEWNFQGAVKRSERTRLRCPVEIAERPGKPVEVMLGAVVVGNDR